MGWSVTTWFLRPHKIGARSWAGRPILAPFSFPSYAGRGIERTAVGQEWAFFYCRCSFYTVWAFNKMKGRPARYITVGRRDACGPWPTAGGHRCFYYKAEEGEESLGFCSEVAVMAKIVIEWTEKEKVYFFFVFLNYHKSQIFLSIELWN